ncbi:MAG: GDP-L-fucose synthase, partial [Gammaproteobacteria bacterium]
MEQTDKIFIAGHRGLVGSAIQRNLHKKGFNNIVTRGREQMDLCDQSAVFRFLQDERPDYVVVAAAKVGGI